MVLIISIFIIRLKIPVWISGNLQWRMEQHFPKFPEKGALCGILKFSEISYREFEVHLIFLPEVSGICGWMIPFSVKSTFTRFSGKFPRKFHFFLFVPFSEFAEFLVERKARIVGEIIWFRFKLVKLDRQLLCCIFCWPWPWTNHNSYLLSTEKITNRNVLVVLLGVWAQNKRLYTVVDLPS